MIHRVQPLVVLPVPATKILQIDVPANAASHQASSLLVEAEMDAAVDARVIDVVGDVTKVRVLQRHVWNGRMRERDRVAEGTVEQLGDLASGAAA